MKKAVALVALSLVAGSASIAAAQNGPAPVPQAPEPQIVMPVDSSDESAEGVDVIRVEQEMKITVPENQVEAVREYLKKHYVGRLTFLDRGGHQIVSRTSDEYFLDRYFDTPQMQLLRDSSGIRIRSRSIPGDTANKKDGRELVQVKLRRVGDNKMSRSEIKFAVDHSGGGGWEGSHPVVGIIQQDQRPLFLKRMDELSIDAKELREVADVKQRRWRVYIGDQVGSFVTITLDQTSTERWGAKANWTEIEIELNEIRYTSASIDERKVMETMIPDIWADLQKNIPGLVQDQTPKYNKSVAKLTAASPMYGLMLKGMMHQEQGLALAGVMLVVGVGAGASVRNRRNRNGGR